MADQVISKTEGKGDMGNGYNPFHYAASVGNVEILRILFENAPREILRCCQPVHPIHLAIIGGHLKCVNLIDETRKGTNISRKFRVHIIEQAKVEREILLGHVCGTKYDVNHVIEIPVSQSGALWPKHPTSKTTFSAMGFVSATPLMIAAALGEVDIARSLIQHGASVNNMDTALHFAARKGQTQVIELLISFGASVNVRNLFLATPCMTAAGRGHLASVELLVKWGAILTLQDEVGWMAVHHAAYKSRSLDVIVFLAHKMKDSDIFADTKNGYSMWEASTWVDPP